MSAQITVHVAESERSVPEQTTAAELFDGDRAVLVARVNGELRDLAHVLAPGDVVDIAECRRLSARKAWKVVRVVKRAGAV